MKYLPIAVLAIFLWVPSALAVREMPVVKSQCIVGKVEIAPGIATSKCTARLDGTPYGAKCGENGYFIISDMVPGRWQLQIMVDTYPTYSMPVIIGGDDHETAANVGTIVVGYYGAVAGHVQIPGSLPYGDVIVGVDGFGIFAKIDSSGGYLLKNVPPGNRRITVTAKGYAPLKATAVVNSGSLTRDVDFQFPAQLQTPFRERPKLPGWGK